MLYKIKGKCNKKPITTRTFSCTATQLKPKPMQLRFTFDSLALRPRTNYSVVWPKYALTNLVNPSFATPEPRLCPFVLFRSKEAAPRFGPTADGSLLIRFLLLMDAYRAVSELRLIILAPFFTSSTASSEYVGVSECTVSAVTGASLLASASIPNCITPKSPRERNQNK